MPGRQNPSPGERNPPASQTDLDRSDKAIVDSIAQDSGRDPADRIPGTLADDDDIYKDVQAHPASEDTALNETSGYEETADGLSDLEETVRQQAEDRAVGDEEDFQP